MLIDFGVFLLVFVYLVFIMSGGGNGFVLSNFIDLPSLLIILLLVVPSVIANGMGGDFLRALKLTKKGYTCKLSEMKKALEAVKLVQKRSIYSGVLVTLLSLIYLLINYFDSATLGANIAVALMTVLYACIIVFLLSPVQAIINRKIADYLEEE